MTKEQAIKNLLEIVELSRDEIKSGNTNIAATLDYEDLKSLQIALEMIKEKDNIIKGKETVIETQAENKEVLLNTLNKKDKQIDLMARAFKQDDVRTVEEIKQYFERKSEE